MDAEPGKQLNLRAVPAPSETEAAKYYPAIYWYSMLNILDESQFGGKSELPANIMQRDYLNLMKNNGCIGCHQLASCPPAPFPHPTARSAHRRKPGCTASNPARPAS